MSFKIRNYQIPNKKRYTNHWNKDRLHHVYDDAVAAILEEQGFIIESEPRSIYKVSKLYEALDKFDPDHSKKVDGHNKYVKQGIRFAWACYGRPKDIKVLTPLDLNIYNVAKLTSNPVASAGATNWHKSKGDSMALALEKAELVLARKKVPEPCIALARTQKNDKTRLVWGYPYSMTIIEGIFARPLINKFRDEYYTPMVIGVSTGRIGSKLRTQFRSKKFAYSIDMSSFDASIQRFFINIAFEIIKSWFNVIYHPQLDLIRDYFIYTPIIMPDGNLYLGKKHGVPSGSYFTQLVDSIVNSIIAGALSVKFNLGIEKMDTLILGDDLLIFSNNRAKLDTMSKFVTGVMKVKMNAEKSKIFTKGQPVHFLGRDWDNGVPDIPIQEMVNKMVQPENYRKYGKDKNREVLLLLYSYSLVYKSAYNILARSCSAYTMAPVLLDSYVKKVTFDPKKSNGMIKYLAKMGSFDMAKPHWLLRFK